MRPDQLVTCACCGAQARASFSSGAAAWREGWPLSLVWTHGPHPRWHVVHEAPALCSWCFERRQALGDDAEPLYRPAPNACPYCRPGAPCYADDPNPDPATRCIECNGRGWHPGDCHPREECGACDGTGRAAAPAPHALASGRVAPMPLTKPTQLGLF